MGQWDKETYYAIARDRDEYIVASRLIGDLYEDEIDEILKSIEFEKNFAERSWNPHSVEIVRLSSLATDEKLRCEVLSDEFWETSEHRPVDDDFVPPSYFYYIKRAEIAAKKAIPKNIALGRFIEDIEWIDAPATLSVETTNNKLAIADPGSTNPLVELSTPMKPSQRGKKQGRHISPRSKLFLKWQSEGKGAAAIRDCWNDLSHLERKKVDPQNPSKYSDLKKGMEAVRGILRRQKTKE